MPNWQTNHYVQLSDRPITIPHLSTVVTAKHDQTWRVNHQYISYLRSSDKPNLQYIHYYQIYAGAHFFIAAHSLLSETIVWIQRIRKFTQEYFRVLRENVKSMSMFVCVTEIRFRDLIFAECPFRWWSSYPRIFSTRTSSWRCGQVC